MRGHCHGLLNRCDYLEVHASAQEARVSLLYFISSPGQIRGTVGLRLCTKEGPNFANKITKSDPPPDLSAEIFLRPKAIALLA